MIGNARLANQKMDMILFSKDDERHLQTAPAHRNSKSQHVHLHNFVPLMRSAFTIISSSTISTQIGERWTGREGGREGVAC